MHTSISGVTWERLQRESSVTYPCLTQEDPGEPIVFVKHFDTDDGRVHLVPADIIPANERPDAQYPFVLITGRQLEHWHTGSMTRRATVLDAIEPADARADIEHAGARPDLQERGGIPDRVGAVVVPLVEREELLGPEAVLRADALGGEAALDALEMGVERHGRQARVRAIPSRRFRIAHLFAPAARNML